MKTAAVSDHPTIGVVSTHEAWARLLAEAVNQPGLVVTPIGSHQIAQAGWYKIVWLVEVGHAQNQVITQALRATHQPLIVVFPYVSPVLSDLDQSDTSWSDYHLAERRQLVFLIESLPGATFVLVPNLTLPPPLSSLSTDLDWLIAPLTKGVLFDPDIALSLTNWKEAVDNIGQVLVRPHSSQTILFSPPQISSTALLKEIQTASMKQNGEHPDILTRSVRVDPAYPPHSHQVALHVSARQTLYGFLSQIELPAAVTKPSIPPPTVPSVSSPDPSSASTTTSPSPVVFSPTPLPPSTPHLVQDFSLSQSLSSIFTHTNAIQQQNYLTQITKTEVKEGKRSGRRKRLFVFGSLSVSLALTAIFLFGLFSVNLSLVKNNLVNQLFSSGQTSGLTAKVQPWLVQTLLIQAKAYNFLLSNPRLDEAEAVVKSTQLLVQAKQETQSGQTEGQKLVGSLLGANDAEIEPTARNVALHSRSAYEFWSQLQASADQIDLSAAGVSVDSDNSQATLDGRLKSLGRVEKIMPLITWLAKNNKTTLAVLLQNSQELRPTGGFIQAVGVLNLERGRLVAHSTHSSYSLDNKISGQVVAPDDIRAILGESNFYFRDSNWDANFPTSAQKSGWFLDKGLNKQIDGTIAINTIALPTLLAAIGPVELPTYNEVITPANVAERLEFHSEIQLTPGSQDYTTTLLEAILTQIKGLKPEKYPALAQALADMLDEQGALIAFNDKDNQQILTELGWTGAILTPPCPAQFASPSCQVDTLAQVEANVGVNKANYYVDKALTHQVVLTKTAAQHDRLIRYTNTAKSNAWPRGPYKAYIRLYLPEKATGVEVEFNQTKLAGQSIKTYSEYSKQVVALAIEVPVNTTKDLRVRYTTPLTSGSPDKTDKYNYVLFDQKQPGTAPMPVKTTIQLSDDLSPTLIAPQAEVLDKKIIFHSTSQTHLLYGISAN